MKVVIVTNIPTPYRVPVFNILAGHSDINLNVFYMAKIEDNRKWELPTMDHKHTFFDSYKTVKKTDGFNYVHMIKGVWKKLNELDPDIVITGGFNPPQLRAWLWAKTYGKKHIAWSDGWLISESNLSPLHKILRKLIFSTSSAFIGASRNTLDLFESYGIKRDKMFLSPHCANNAKISSHHKNLVDREYDLIFSGTLTNRKNPLFLVSVLKILKNDFPKISIVFLGNGPLKNELEAELLKLKVHFNIAGHVSQEDIPNYMSNAKIHVFPTLLDAWGLVVNEAAACGTPTITSPNAGVINDLVLQDKTGIILDLNEKSWAKTIRDLLTQGSKLNLLSVNASKAVHSYSFENASEGILRACNSCFSD